MISASLLAFYDISKGICHEPDWFMQNESFSFLSGSKGSRLNFLIAMKIQEIEIESRKKMEFYSKRACYIKQLTHMTYAL